MVSVRRQGWRFLRKSWKDFMVGKQLIIVTVIRACSVSSAYFEAPNEVHDGQ